MMVTAQINGRSRTWEVKGSESLLFSLREELGLWGSKGACEQGECGSCSIMLDGKLVCACLVMAVDAHQSEVVTIEGLRESGSLHPVQKAIVEAGGVQCGFCTPGFVVAAAALFEENPAPLRDDIREALSGNICRCTGYGAILRGLEELAEENR